MNKEIFYTQFRSALAGLGCDKELINEWVAAASEYVGPMQDSDFEKKYDDFTVNRLVDRIISSPDTALDEVFRGAAKKDNPAERPFPEEKESGDEVPDEDENTLPDVLDAVFSDDVDPDDESAYAQDEIPSEMNMVGSLDDDASGDTQVFDVSTDEDVVVVDRAKLKRVARERKLSERRYIQGSPLFYFLLIVLFPIWGSLYALIWVAVGALFLAVGALMAGFIIAMVGIIGAGTALSLVGIIYGIVKLFSQMPIGLFEIGIGITVGGVTMLVSILIYNLAIRVIPKLFKPVKKLSRLISDKLADLYYTIKKECGRK